MVSFTVTLQQQVCVQRLFGRGCTDFNLRDVFRWCDLLTRHQLPGAWRPEDFLDLIFCRRMRSAADRRRT